MPGGPTYRLHGDLPTLEAPVLVAHLTGWIDASGAGAAALAAVQQHCGVRPLATFDGDTYLDYRARRPTMELRDGVNERLVWPEIELLAGRTPAGSDVVVLTGPEPDSAWRRFAAEVTELAGRLGVRMAVFLGAYPFAAPHTRPSRLSSSSPSPDLVASLPFLTSSVDVPAGMGAVLEHAFAAAGVPAVGLWAQVPHYLGTMSHPAASVALLDGLERVSGLVVDRTELAGEAEIQRLRVDQLVGSNPEHRSMVEQLEVVYDASAPVAAADGAGEGLRGDLGAGLGGELPSGDDIAAEVERFLRDQGD